MRDLPRHALFGLETDASATTQTTGCDDCHTEEESPW